jgi:hypothetical protein
MCQVYEWTKITFWLDYFAFWALFTQAPCVSGILQLRKPKSCQNFQMLFFSKKRMGNHPPWKVPLFVRHKFSRERNSKPNLKFYLKNAVFLIYRMVPKLLVFLWWIAATERFKTVAVLGLCEVLAEGYVTEFCNFYYGSIYIDSNL